MEALEALGSCDLRGTEDLVDVDRRQSQVSWDVRGIEKNCPDDERCDERCRRGELQNVSPGVSPPGANGPGGQRRSGSRPARTGAPYG